VEDRVHLAELWHNLNKLQLQVSESTFMRVQLPELWHDLHKLQL